MALPRGALLDPLTNQIDFFLIKRPVCLLRRHPLAGVIGSPISHSKSPRLHGHWLKKYGLPGYYVPMDVAKELTFTGRILDGEAARALGLVTHVSDDPLASALELAREIASKSPDAIRSGKRLFEETWHADARTGLALEARLQGRLIGSPNQVESIKANFEKRAPRFEDPTS